MVGVTDRHSTCQSRMVSDVQPLPLLKKLGLTTPLIHIAFTRCGCPFVPLDAILYSETMSVCRLTCTMTMWRNTNEVCTVS